MKIDVTERTRLRRASASLRQGRIHVQVPRHWPKPLKHEAVLELVEKVLAGEARRKRLLDSEAARGPRITLSSREELRAYVDRLNSETFGIALGKVRIGHARYTRLAQMNLRTRTMTVSRYCLEDVPEAALRYLLLHELAHGLEARHNKRFWALVAQFMPDYRKQSRIIQAFHQQAVLRAEAAASPIDPLRPASPANRFFQALQLRLFAPAP